MARHTDFTKKIDRIISQRVTQFRIESKLSRQSLAERIKISQQQLQKYETNVNRISVGRLALIAKVLGKPLEHFYKDIDDLDDMEYEPSKEQQLRDELLKRFVKIRKPEHQDMIINLVKELSSS